MAVALVVGLFGEAGCRIEERRATQDEHVKVTNALSHIRAELEAELNAALYTTNGLVAYVVTQSELESTHIDAMLKVLHDQVPNVRNIGIAPGNRLSHVYPLAGNEKVLGLYYPDVAEQWPAIERAIARRQPILAGPVPLKQGGTALIYRLPVFEAPQARYWGLISMVLDTERLFAQAGLAPRTDTLQLALRGKDGTGERGEVILGEPSLFAQDAVMTTISMPGGTWQLAGRPLNGWTAAARVDGIRLLAWTTASAFGLAVYWALASAGRRLRAEQALRASEHRLQEQKNTLSVILETSSVGIAHLRDRRVIWCNGRLGELFGCTSSDLEGCSTRVLYPSEEAFEALGAVAYRELDQGRRFLTEQEMLHRDGHTLWMRIQGQAVTPGDSANGSIWVFEDLTDRRRAELELMRLASTDTLTGVANRHRFLKQFRAELERSRRQGIPGTLLMLDLDHFKRVNDTHGHAAGDAVLMRFAELALQHTRSTDIVGRLGGEEFAIVLSETGEDGARQFAERFRHSVQDLSVEGPKGPIHVTVSIGLVVFDGRSGHPDLLLGQADEALYRAKAEGRNNVQVYSPSHNPS